MPPTNDRTPGSTAETLAQGRYVLEQELGRGATATVWQSTDTVLGVQRAIKLLSLRASASKPLRRRLLAEARAMARLDHPNILRVFDIGYEGERDYVVMSLARSGSLADWVDAYGPMPPDMALAHIIQVLSALHVAHTHGIVHRDVKPQNILIDDDGTALLADFGIALLAEDQLRSTRTGVAMGSLAFMAPEQRLDARSVTAAADIYASGTTLYNLLTAANPVDLFTAEADSPRWAGIPADLAAAIRKAVAYAPTDRFPDARTMARHLRALLADAESVPLPPPPEAPQMPGWEETERPRGGTLPPQDLRPPAAAVHTAFTFLADEDGEEPITFDLPELPGTPSMGAAAAAASAAAMSRATLTPMPVEPPASTPNLAASDSLTIAPELDDSPPAPTSRWTGEPTVDPDAALFEDRPPDRRAWMVGAVVLLLLIGLGGALGPRLFAPADPQAPAVATAPGPDWPGLADPTAGDAIDRTPVEAGGDEAAGGTSGSAANEGTAQDGTAQDGTARDGAAQDQPRDTVTSGTGAEPASGSSSSASAAASTSGSNGEEAPVDPDEAPASTAASTTTTASSGGSSGSSPPESGGSGSPVAGTWTGNLGASPGTLVLRQAGSGLSGVLTTTHAITNVSLEVPVVATFSADSRTLVVDESHGAQGDPTAGRITLTLSRDGRTLTGQHRAYVGSKTFPVVLERGS